MANARVSARNPEEYTTHYKTSAGVAFERRSLCSGLEREEEEFVVDLAGKSRAHHLYYLFRSHTDDGTLPPQETSL